MSDPVKEIITALRDHLRGVAWSDGVARDGFLVIQKDQNAPRPQYPFGAWKALQSRRTFGGLPTGRVNVPIADPTKIKERISTTVTRTVSLSFYDLWSPKHDALEMLEEIADEALDWLGYEGARQFSPSVVIGTMESTAQNRTSLQGMESELQIGFDFKVSYSRTKEMEQDAIDLDATLAGTTTEYESE